VTVRQLRLQVQTPARVQLRRVTRIQPALAPLMPTADQSIWLGDLEGGVATLVLLEFLAPGVPRRAAGETTRLRLARIAVQAQPAMLERDLIVQYADAASPLPADVREATAWASAAGLQQRALTAAASGDAATATRLLRATATRLRELGEAELAAAAEREAAQVERNGQLSDIGAKELMYSTRRLGK
jgi:hypothetical protein